MPNKRLFLLVFMAFFLVVVSVGVLARPEQNEKNTSSMQPSPSIATSINTSETVFSEANEISPTDADASPMHWYRNQVVVLSYHHVDAHSDQPFAISLQQFAEQMSFLKEHDLNPITLQQFLHFMDTGSLTTPNAVLITFDDGYESYYTDAFPILRTYGFPSVNFVIAGRLRDVAERKRENMTPPLTRPQLLEMRATGLAEFGSHTYSLHAQEARNEWGDLGPVTAPVYLEELQRLEAEQEYRDRLYVDFSMSRIGLSEWLNHPIEVISLPYGYTNPVVQETAKQAGYKYVFNSNPGVVTSDTDPFAIPRFDVGTREVDMTKLHQLFTKARN
ncbi:polysaccharide deacetylase family protein [Brevibacillus sp. TJ4]|uniref:polysaccharide deacetylase family protein n=1 Tax=Brevibacillus sp. TJ4 TaxID=3234853 RepID=UPI0037D73F89